MPCLHRFYNELLPAHATEFLIVGTFNPIWDIKRGNNPDYFYSRSTSEFWCILPHALNKNCMVDKGRSEKEKFCIDNKIGFTDLIYSIDNVEEEDMRHDFLKKGFKDEDFEKLEDGKPALQINFYTSSIERYIEKNAGTLRGVFFTRKTSAKIPRIWNEWISLKTCCDENGVHAKALCSPSPRGGGLRDKIFEWRHEIERINGEKN